MVLDWDFFFDDWLIDRVPDGFEIRVESRPNGIFINPPELNVYFGANPRYLYGEGKHLHECIVSPSGIAIYPSFLGRPGFEFVEDISFSLGFNESLDFHGNTVIDKHVGTIDAIEYMQNVQEKLYGISPESYFGIASPSLELRSMSTEEVELSILDITNQYVYNDGIPVDSGVKHYYTMNPSSSDGKLYNKCNGQQDLNIISTFATILSPGTYSNVVFLKYSHLEFNVAESRVIWNAIANKTLSVFFSTTGSFRKGILFEYNFCNTETQFSGFRVELYGDRLSISVAGESDIFVYDFFSDTDFQESHKWSFGFNSGYISASKDGVLIQSYDTLNLVVAQDNADYPFLVGGTNSNDKIIHNGIGDIEEFIIAQSMAPETESALYEMGKRLAPDDLNIASSDQIPAQLSYGLTYVSPATVFIPNYFGATFDKFYLESNLGNIQIIGGAVTNSAYIEGGEPYPDHSITIPNDYRVRSSTTNTFDDWDVDGVLGSKIKALTKLTSDTHIPLRVHMKFRLPEFYTKETKFNFALIMKSLDKYLRYEFKKFKTGEFL